MRECPVLHATLDDIRKPFENFIEKHEKKIAQAGIAKIVVPEGWTPRRQGYPDDLDFTIERPIRQHATGSRGLYRGLYIEEKPLSLRRGFRPQALAPENLPPPATDPSDLERKYWKNVTLRPPLYGADVPGSLFDEDQEGWNLRRLDTVLSRVLHEAGHCLPGVNEPYLYFGMWRSTFAWHTEDLDLYSVNYLHYGAPKQWYCIPPDSRRRFELLIKGMLPDLFKACPEFFRHKELIISPQLLDTFAIPYIKTVQRPREFVINFPGAYHAGYNCGYNCAESVNFGTRQWVPLGAAAAVCKCNPDSVTIDMRLFRHLVPARLLPASLFEDSSSSSEEEEEAGEGEEEGQGGGGRRGGSSSAGCGHGAGCTGGGRSMARAMVMPPASREGAAAPPPLPRRRGRPPKSAKRPLEEAAAEGAMAEDAAASAAKRQCVVQQGGDAAAAAAVAVLPRRRGRPPKAAKLAAAAAAAAASGGASQQLMQGQGAWLGAAGFRIGAAACTTALAMPAGDSGLPAAIPRRRGRPPKRPTTLPGGAAPDAGGAVLPAGPPAAAAASAAATAAPSPPKRPRGRPRKYPLPQAAAPASAAVTSSSATAPSPGSAVAPAGVPSGPGCIAPAGGATAAAYDGPAASPAPHKHALPGAVPTAAAAAAVTAAAAAPPPLPVKRPRGRPRKVVPLPAATPHTGGAHGGDAWGYMGSGAGAGAGAGGAGAGNGDGDGAAMGYALPSSAVAATAAAFAAARTATLTSAAAPVEPIWPRLRRGTAETAAGEEARGLSTSHTVSEPQPQPLSHGVGPARGVDHVHVDVGADTLHGSRTYAVHCGPQGAVALRLALAGGARRCGGKEPVVCDDVSKAATKAARAEEKAVDTRPGAIAAARRAERWEGWSEVHVGGGGGGDDTYSRPAAAVEAGLGDARAWAADVEARSGVSRAAAPPPRSADSASPEAGGERYDADVDGRAVRPTGRLLDMLTSFRPVFRLNLLPRVMVPPR